jgi:hypothetical protein
MKQRPPADQSNVLRWSAGVPGGGSGGVSGATTPGSGGPPCLPISQRMAAAAGTSAGATVCAIRPRGALSSRLAASATVAPTRALYSASSAAMTAASETPFSELGAGHLAHPLQLLLLFGRVRLADF